MPLKIILIILGVFRISHLIVYEMGPFDIFSKLRGLIVKNIKTAWIVEGFNCVLCISFWLSAIGAFFVSFDFSDYFIRWFGIAGAVAIISLFIDSGDTNEY